MIGKKANNLLEFRAYIKGRSQLSIKYIGIHREICVIYGVDQMPYRTICRWIAKSRSGQEQLKNAPHTGSPATTTTRSNIEKSQNIIQKDARFTVRQLARLTNQTNKTSLPPPQLTQSRLPFPSE